MSIRTTVSVSVRDHGWNAIKIRARGLDGRGVKAGILPKEANTRGMVRDWQGNVVIGGKGARVADYAVFNEFGTVKMPARPFMRRTADTSRLEAGDESARVAEAIVFRGVAAVHALNGLGAWYAERIKETIKSASGWAAPLSPVTIGRKGHALPLIDFRILLNAIKHALAR